MVHEKRANGRRIGSNEPPQAQVTHTTLVDTRSNMTQVKVAGLVILLFGMAAVTGFESTTAPTVVSRHATQLHASMEPDEYDYFPLTSPSFPEPRLLIPDDKLTAPLTSMNMAAGSTRPTGWNFPRGTVESRILRPDGMNTVHDPQWPRLATLGDAGYGAYKQSPPPPPDWSPAAAWDTPPDVGAF